MYIQDMSERHIYRICMDNVVQLQYIYVKVLG